MKILIETTTKTKGILNLKEQRILNNFKSKSNTKNINSKIFNQ